jgi:hypothetical protein
VALRPTLSSGLPFASFDVYLTADVRRLAQTFLPADSRDFASLAQDKPAGKKHVNRFAIKFFVYIVIY